MESASKHARVGLDSWVKLAMTSSAHNPKMTPFSPPASLSFLAGEERG